MIRHEPASFRRILSTANLYNICMGLSAIALMIASLAAAYRGLSSTYFAWLIFLFPVLWVLWILCACFIHRAYASMKLLALWVAISLAILALFVALAARIESWGHSQGIDTVVMAVYFPVVVPTIYLANLLPSEYATTLSAFPERLMQIFGGGIGDALALWICFSAVASVQCVLLAGIIRLAKKQHQKVVGLD